MLSPALTERLNTQVNLEFQTSALYLQMAAWCEHHGYPGAAAFLAQHASEEHEHGRKLFAYVMETGGLAQLGAVPAPPSEFTGLQQIFEMTLAREVAVTGQINALVRAAMEENDFSTFNFLQWYAAEQHQEERLFRSIIDRFRVIGTEGKGIYWIDKEIGKLSKTVGG
jgi:ferritin